MIRPRPAWITFRYALLDRLDAIAPERFGYLSRDTATHICPACRSGLPHYLAIEFLGETPRARLICTRGCTDTLIAAALTGVLEVER
jgi:hypothetical protein